MFIKREIPVEFLETMMNKLTEYPNFHLIMVLQGFRFVFQEGDEEYLSQLVTFEELSQVKYNILMNVFNHFKKSMEESVCVQTV